MLTREKYETLKGALQTGANLPPCDLSAMAEYEKAQKENCVIAQPSIPMQPLSKTSASSSTHTLTE
jgi:hypothetical protein